ncbi:hypothetical protein KXS11_09925 [Plantibacter flavus]|uniref:hypothetical protein n=1 Tax=Plantibacter flavus TaxID=150123 RepID=UPI003F166A67
MKLKKALTAFGAVSIAASGLLNTPAAFASAGDPATDPSVERSTEQVELNAGGWWRGKLVTFSEKNTQNFMGVYGPKINQSVTGTYGYGLDAAVRDASPNWVWPGVGVTGPVVNYDNPAYPLCLETNTQWSVWAAECKPGAASQSFTMAWFDNSFTQGYGLKDHNGNFLDGGQRLNLTNGKHGADQILTANAVPADAPDVNPAKPTASVTAPSLERGQSKEVTVTFNAAAGGQRIDVYQPTGTKITSTSDPAFQLDGSGIGGTLPAGQTTLKFTITANADAAFGTVNDGKVTYGSGRTKISDFGATITEAAAPAPSVAVSQSVKPTLANNEVGDVTFPFVNSGGAAYGEADFTFTAPDNSTFTEALYHYELNGATGTKVATLSGDKKTLTAKTGGFNVPANSTLNITVKIKADDNASSGEQAGGSLRFDDDVVVPAGTTVPMTYTKTVAAAPVSPLVVTSPAVGGEVFTGANGVVNPTFRGKATPGATIQIKTAWGDDVGSIPVDANGDWSITWTKALRAGVYTGGMTNQFIDGKRIDAVGYNFTVKAPFTAPLKVEAPAVGGTFEADASGTATPVFSGTATPGARVEIRTAWQDLVGWDTADAKTGAWSIAWNKSLKPARYLGGNTIQSINGAEQKVGYDFTVTAAKAPVSVASPANNATIQADPISGKATPVFTGTGAAGARIKIVTAYGTNVGEGTVSPSGEWSIRWEISIVPTDYKNVRTLQYIDGKFDTDTFTNFTVTK